MFEFAGALAFTVVFFLVCCFGVLLMMRALILEQYRNLWQLTVANLITIAFLCWVSTQIYG
jgi:hypothetical protein